MTLPQIRPISPFIIGLERCPASEAAATRTESDAPVTHFATRALRRVGRLPWPRSRVQPGFLARKPVVPVPDPRPAAAA